MLTNFAARSRPALTQSLLLQAGAAWPRLPPSARTLSTADDAPPSPRPRRASRPGTAPTENSPGRFRRAGEAASPADNAQVLSETIVFMNNVPRGVTDDELRAALPSTVAYVRIGGTPALLPLLPHR
jgi:hypothetical protein